MSNIHEIQCILNSSISKQFGGLRQSVLCRSILKKIRWSHPITYLLNQCPQMTVFELDLQLNKMILEKKTNLQCIERNALFTFAKDKSNRYLLNCMRREEEIHYCSF
eukprot:NODE_863_length_3436_cov_1.124064.p3 type:complete len:107 gc:universal NODE_863_length_3436_cov_1.124064:493-813(+)